MEASNNCYDLIEKFEGLYLHEYLCPAGVPTIGYGTTRIDSKPIPTGLTITQEQADYYLQLDVDKTANEVNNLIQVQVSQNQFDALVSLAYNIGTTALKNSTLLRLLNSGNSSAAADQFLRWNKAAGHELPGLTRRRKAERELFLS